MALPTTRQWNGWNFFVCYLVSLGCIAFGYPSSIISVTLAQPPFLIYMGLLDITKNPPVETSKASGVIGAMSGVYQAGAAVNVFIATWVADKYGRKWGCNYCSLLGLFGGALICGAQNTGMFIAGRFFAGAGAWGFLAVSEFYIVSGPEVSTNAIFAPFYCAELAPPQLRGLMVGMIGVNIAFGYAFATYMGLAFSYVKDSVTQWRAPLGIALIWPLLMIAICFVVPESPRYLLMHGRVEEARAVVFKLHAIKADPAFEFARSEFYQMSKQAEMDREVTPGWIELFRNSSYRTRVIMAVGLGFFAQSTGVLVLNNYGPTIYASLGYDTHKQLVYQAGWVSMGLCANVFGAVLMDWTGRKPLLITGLVGCCIFLILESAMVSSFAAQGTNKAGLQVGVAATYLFLFIYSLGIDVAGYVFFSELFPNNIRARGMALVICIQALADLLYLQVAPTAFRNIGWKFFLVFIILSALGAIWVFFVIPETKGIPLEEMGRIFGDKVAVYEADLHIDTKANELVVEQHGVPDGQHVQRVATKAGVPELDVEKHGRHNHAATIEHLDKTSKS